MEYHGTHLSNPLRLYGTPSTHCTTHDDTLKDHTDTLGGPTNIPYREPNTLASLRPPLALVPEAHTDFPEGPTSLLRTTLTYVSHELTN